MTQIYFPPHFTLNPKGDFTRLRNEDGKWSLWSPTTDESKPVEIQELRTALSIDDDMDKVRDFVVAEDGAVDLIRIFKPMEESN